VISAAIEHLPHVGADFDNGVDGLKVAVVGYSHYPSPGDVDSAAFSQAWITRVVTGSDRSRFLTSIRNSFGFREHSEFWSKIVFFNYVPVMIGGAGDKFRRANREEEEWANRRLLRIIDDLKPDIVFVFTRKARLEGLGLAFKPMASPYERFAVATHDSDGHRVDIVRLRHTQGAYTAHLQGAVRSVMDEVKLSR
jgi:hypothetical protein